jgi:peptide/nickel transport system permease protein
MQRHFFGQRFKMIAGASVLLAICAIAAFAPYLAPYDPFQQNLLRRLKPPVFMTGGSSAHLLGTDNYGRDLLSRLMYGARTSILVGTAAMLLSCVLGAIAGILAGYRGGRTEMLIMRFADAHMSFPDVLLAIVVAAAFGGSTFNLVIVLGVSGWMIYARLVYGMVRSLKQQGFIEAAISYGARDSYIMLRHLLPQIVPMLSVLATLQIAQMILQEAALSFLGLGLPPPAPTWGNILAEGRDRMFGAPWIANSAGCAIILIVVGVNMLGNGLREKLDPQSRSR